MRRGDLSTQRILTDAGERLVTLVGHRRCPTSSTPRSTWARCVAIAEPADWHRVGADPLRPVRHLSLGNPHTVVGGRRRRRRSTCSRSGSVVPYVNLEIIEAGPEPHAITMRVHERGAGITEACGTGACASAWAASEWGLVPAVGEEIVVHMDGGDAKVRLHHPRQGGSP